jgi:hypothetical protein
MRTSLVVSAVLYPLLSGLFLLFDLFLLLLSDIWERICLCSSACWISGLNRLGLDFLEPQFGVMDLRESFLFREDFEATKDWLLYDPMAELSSIFWFLYTTDELSIFIPPALL